MPRRHRPRDHRQLMIPESRPRGHLQWVDTQFIASTDEVAPEQLIESIRALGIIQPVALVAIAREAEDEDHRFEIAAGLRRVAAARVLMLREVPALVYPQGTSRTVAAAMSLTENIVRRTNPVVEALEARRLLDEGYTADEICQRLQLPPRTFHQRLRLSALPAHELQLVREGAISAAVAREMTYLDEEQRNNVIAHLRQGASYTVRQLRAMRRDSEQVEAMEVVEATEVDEPVADAPVTTTLTVGIDTRELQRELQYAADRIDRLRRENESLRVDHGARIDGLVAENNRLRELLDRAAIGATTEVERVNANGQSIPSSAQRRRTFATLPDTIPVDAAREQQRAGRAPLEQRWRAALAHAPHTWRAVMEFCDTMQSLIPDSTSLASRQRAQVEHIRVHINELHDMIQPFVEPEAPLIVTVARSAQSDARTETQRTEDASTITIRNSEAVVIPPAHTRENARREASRAASRLGLTDF